ncbi:MAG TPA: hypothetical protein VGX68_10420 [Thermoanaerobaculia bacterium]|nr:hypothetical protein [Thermoanaerobaculia bacterium]
MPRIRRYLNFLNGWEQITTAVVAHADELPHLEGLLFKLQTVLEKMRDASAQQAALTASKQEASKLVLSLLRQGEALADVLRTAVREHYGNSSEILVEFGLQPFRGRTRATTTKPPVNPPVEIAESPTSTSTPETTE